jgi:hypothetical protein
VDVLVEDGDLRGRLDDFKRVRHVVDARRPHHVALRFRIVDEPSPAVLLPFRQRQRQIGNLVAFDDALAGRQAKFR